MIYKQFSKGLEFFNEIDVEMNADISNIDIVYYPNHKTNHKNPKPEIFHRASILSWVNSQKQAINAWDDNNGMANFKKKTVTTPTYRTVITEHDVLTPYAPAILLKNIFLIAARNERANIISTVPKTKEADDNIKALDNAINELKKDQNAILEAERILNDYQNGKDIKFREDYIEELMAWGITPNNNINRPAPVLKEKQAAAAVARTVKIPKLDDDDDLNDDMTEEEKRQYRLVLELSRQDHNNFRPQDDEDDQEANDLAEALRLSLLPHNHGQHIPAPEARRQDVPPPPAMLPQFQNVQLQHRAPVLPAPVLPPNPIQQILAPAAPQQVVPPPPEVVQQAALPLPPTNAVVSSADLNRMGVFF